jgi:hypothetical protein
MLYEIRERNSGERRWRGLETWVKPDFEEVGVNAECSAYAAAR